MRAIIMLLLMFCAHLQAQEMIYSTIKTIRTGDVVIYADSREETGDLYFRYIDADTPEAQQETLAFMDTIMSSYILWDWIDRDKWKIKPDVYKGIDPVCIFGSKIMEVHGARGNMYMFAPNPNKAPRMGHNRIRWSEDTEMWLVIDKMAPDNKPYQIIVKEHINILLYYRKLGEIKDVKSYLKIK